MNTANEYSLEFIHSNKKYSITYTIQMAVKPKGELMYRLTFPLVNGKNRVIVVFKNKAGKFSAFKENHTPLVIAAINAINKTETGGTQIIKLLAR